MRSIIPGDYKNICHYCERFFEKTHKHHIFGGPNRKWSEKYGLYVHLCPEHHNMSNHSVHHDKEIMDAYHQLGQKCFEVEHSHDEFMRIFGRNYL